MLIIYTKLESLTKEQQKRFSELMAKNLLEQTGDYVLFEGFYIQKTQRKQTLLG